MDNVDSFQDMCPRGEEEGEDGGAPAALLRWIVCFRDTSLRNAS